MRYLLRNFIFLLCLSGVSTQALSSALLKTSKLSPRHWAAIEKALWGKVYAPNSKGKLRELHLSATHKSRFVLDVCNSKGKLRELHLFPPSYSSVNSFASVASINSNSKGKLSKLHGREAIGTPEAHQLLATQEFPYHASEIRIFDAGFDNYKDFLSSPQALQSLRLDDTYRLLEDSGSSDEPDHGMLVAHLLARKSPLPGISTRGKISLLSNADPLRNSDYSQYLALPGVINLSKDIYTDDLNALAPLSNKTLFVTSAGNDFPGKSRNVILASRALEQEGMAKLIPVGAIDSDGVIRKSSVSNRSVAITAPGERLFSFDGKEKKEVRDTSAAAPFVSGVLADVRSILPQLTQDNAVQLLKGTAIKTATNEVSKLDGAGVVNHYKMLRVALRLAQDGYDGERMPDDLAAYLDFSHEVADLMDTFTDAIEFFLNLRRAFFLDPNNNDLRIQLANAYRLMGLEQQAVFYDAPTEAVLFPQVKEKFEKRVDRLKEALNPIND